MAYLASDVFCQRRLDFIRNKDLPEGEGLYYRFSRLARRGLFYTATLTRGCFISEETVERNFAALIDDIDISATRILFAAAATDLTGGKEFVLDWGNLRRDLAASCAIPGVLPPVPWGEMRFVDGGWTDAVPIEQALRLGADLVIAVDVARDISEREHGRCALDIIFRADTISRYTLAREKLTRADIILRPAVQALHCGRTSPPRKGHPLWPGGGRGQPRRNFRPAALPAIQDLASPTLVAASFFTAGRVGRVLFWISGNFQGKNSGCIYEGEWSGMGLSERGPCRKRSFPGDKRTQCA